MASTEKSALTPTEQYYIDAINHNTHSGHADEKSKECADRQGLVAKIHDNAGPYTMVNLDSLKKIVDEVCKDFPEHSRPNSPSDVTVTPPPTHNTPSSRAR